MIYSISSYRKKWFEYTPDKIVNSSSDLVQSNRLILICISYQFDELINFKIKRVLTIVQIYYLEILEKDICIDQLIQIINSLPDLNSIKIHALLLAQSTDLCGAKVDIHSSTNRTNKITKVYLKNYD
ncbi:unnamed protein product [Rotaria sp. Silwood1]|nr:unnamed protein product [Rotaria sp. Silwood1]CAF1646243.1 unnamed protein product [Rotaria sp. Silwood1]CAF3855459.1 unnamed protein product [Rotaria sp. Silwood1]CAF3947773.1 unnamed protein product [Rotaria sp. Silwood1]CAF5010062.1 unnamed protein product [Rotaria sp. Silwood1]